MTRTAKLLTAAPVVVVVAFFALGMYSKTGNPPGLSNGQLAACPSKPNCVSSESAPSDPHSVEGIRIPSTGDKHPLSVAQKAIVDLGGQVTFANDEYLAATFTSKVFGFVDDVELQIDSGSGLIHIRSASRVGYSDWGANRKRVEAIRQKIAEQLKPQ